MMGRRSLTISDLIGETLTSAEPYGENGTSDELTAGYVPEQIVDFVPQTVIGPPVIGPLEDQQFVIYRDVRPIAADELGQQGPWVMLSRAIARRAAGRTFPFNLEFGPAGLDTTFPGRPPTQDTLHPSPLSPLQEPQAHVGLPPVEVLGPVETIYYTASPNVGWAGY